MCTECFAHIPSGEQLCEVSALIVPFREDTEAARRRSTHTKGHHPQPRRYLTTPLGLLCSQTCSSVTESLAGPELD